MDDAGDETHHLEVALKALAHARPHDLHGHRPLRPIGIEEMRLVDLGDGGGRHRRAERNEHLPDRLAEGRHDDLLGDILREGRHPVLELLKVEGRIHADDVGPRRQELSELDVGRPEPCQSPLQRSSATAEAGPLQHPPETKGEAQMRRQRLGVDEGEPALARQHEADPRPARQVDEGA